VVVRVNVAVVVHRYGFGFRLCRAGKIIGGGLVVDVVVNSDVVVVVGVVVVAVVVGVVVGLVVVVVVVVVVAVDAAVVVGVVFCFSLRVLSFSSS
jgi:hypothetical protein